MDRIVAAANGAEIEGGVRREIAAYPGSWPRSTVRICDLTLDSAAMFTRERAVVGGDACCTSNSVAAIMVALSRSNLRRAASAARASVCDIKDNMREETEGRRE